MTLNSLKNTFFSKQDVSIYCTNDDNEGILKDYLAISINSD